MLWLEGVSVGGGPAGYSGWHSPRQKRGTGGEEKISVKEEPVYGRRRGPDVHKDTVAVCAAPERVTSTNFTAGSALLGYISITARHVGVRMRTRPKGDPQRPTSQTSSEWPCCRGRDTRIRLVRRGAGPPWYKRSLGTRGHVRPRDARMFDRQVFSMFT